MIVFIINGYLFDNAGFSKRCQRELEILAQQENILVVCRDRYIDKAIVTNKNIQVVTFSVAEPLVENPKHYKSGFYELYRNIKLFFPLIQCLFKILKENRKENITLYVVSSPMTVPLFCLFLSKYFNIKNTILEFHDLEPEMAMTIKRIQKKHFIIQIEYFLEKILCKSYSKIIVTSDTQKEIIAKRANISKQKIFTLFNSIHAITATHKNTMDNTVNFDRHDFVIGYISSMTFEYTVSGICMLLEKMANLFRTDHTLKFVIIGDGDMQYKIKNTIAEHKLEKNVFLIGKISNPESFLRKLDVGIIPLIKDAHTASVIPTRLFEYFAVKKAVIVPDFSSFREVVTNNVNGLLFTSIDDLAAKILFLRNHPITKEKLAKEGYSLFLKKFALPNYAKQYTDFLYM